MGCSVALRLQQSGLSTLVLERSVPGAEASSAAAGMLAPDVEAAHPTAIEHAATLRSLGRWSRELHSRQASWLREAHGIDVGFRTCGALVTAFEDEIEDEEPATLDAHCEALDEGALFERIDGAEAREREPNLSASVSEALWLPGEAQLEPRSFLRAMALAAEAAGVRFRSGAYVRDIVVEGGRALGVRVGAETLHASQVVVAAGSWSSLIPGLDLEAAKVHPIRGQILATESRPPLFRSLVFSRESYIVTRPDGRVLCGSTEERVGYRREVTLGGVRDIIGRTLRLAPSLIDAPLLDQWSSFRPGTADGLPLVGPAGPEGVTLASGHFRNGILLAPATAELVVASITGNVPTRTPAHHPTVELASRAFQQLLDPRRFADTSGASS